ncbi:MAG: hypothetical protein QXN37_04205 [Candidatus Anstonellaceae archaeon]
MSKELQQEALEKGEVQIRCKRAGMFQLVEFKIKRLDSPAGKIPYLVAERFVDLQELIRIAEEYSLPVLSPSGKVFPKGKKESDFAGL